MDAFSRFAPLVFSLLLFAGCRDYSRQCRTFVQKYTSCMKEAHQRATSLASTQAAVSKKRSLPLLKRLAEKLNEPQREDALYQRCLADPPSRELFVCIQKAPCDRLSQCNKKLRSLE